jgi:hypothetical protein
MTPAIELDQPDQSGRDRQREQKLDRQRGRDGPISVSIDNPGYVSDQRRLRGFGQIANRLAVGWHRQFSTYPGYKNLAWHRKNLKILKKPVPGS